MRRDQVEHAIRAACQIIGRPEVIVLGSQAILGTFGEDELPVLATMSAEVDILPIADSNEETAELTSHDLSTMSSSSLAGHADIDLSARPASCTWPRDCRDSNRSPAS